MFNYGSNKALSFKTPIINVNYFYINFLSHSLEYLACAGHLFFYIDFSTCLIHSPIPLKYWTHSSWNFTVCNTDANKSNIFHFNIWNHEGYLRVTQLCQIQGQRPLLELHVLTAGEQPLTEAQFHATPAGSPQAITGLVSQQKCLACKRFIQ